jgi:hypothetical protein
VAPRPGGDFVAPGKNVKVVKKLSKFKSSGADDDDDEEEEEEEEEEDWWLQDQVATLSHLVIIL